MCKYRYDKFECFLRCYFIQGVGISDLDKVMEEYISLESQKSIKKLARQLNHIIKINDWSKIRELAIKYGYRNNLFDVEISKQLVESMLKNLRKE